MPVVENVVSYQANKHQQILRGWPSTYDQESSFEVDYVRQIGKLWESKSKEESELGSLHQSRQSNDVAYRWTLSQN